MTHYRLPVNRLALQENVASGLSSFLPRVGAESGLWSITGLNCFQVRLGSNVQRNQWVQFHVWVTPVLLVLTSEYLREEEEQLGEECTCVCFQEALRSVGVFQEVVFSGMSAGRDWELLWVCWSESRRLSLLRSIVYAQCEPSVIHHFSSQLFAFLI